MKMSKKPNNGRKPDNNHKAEEVKSLKQRIEFILSATKVGLDIIDSEFNMVYIDPEWGKIYGDYKGKKCYEYFAGRDTMCPGCGILEALKSKRTVVKEEILPREGNRPIEVITTPFQTGKGQWFVAEVNIDISERKKAERELKKAHDQLEAQVRERTAIELEKAVAERKKAEEELKESEAKFRTLFDDSKDGILLADLDTRKFRMWNKEICKMLGYTEEEIKDLGVSDIHPVEYLPNVIEQFEHQSRGDFKFAEALPVKRKDGSVFYADVNASTVTLNGKKYLMGSFRDITERIRSDDALKMSEANYRAIFESANDAIIIRDVNTYAIVDVNDRACEMFCYAKEEMIGMALGAINANSAQHTDEGLKALFEKAAGYEPQVFEWLVKDKFGREFWVETNVKRSIIGGRYQFLSIVRDITERKHLLEQREKFMNMVSHELRTPLGAIKESVALISEGMTGPINEKHKEIIDIAKRNVDRLARLVSQVLDLQKIDAGGMELKPEENDMNETIKEVYKPMILLAAKKGLKFVLKLDDDLPRVRFDRDRIIEVLTNLVSNAVKFTEEGSVTITSARGSNFIKISVKDTGPGITTEDMPKLFRRFSQLKRKPGGTGLGLTISKEIIDLHKGKMEVESEFGKGSAFSFFLPIKERRR